LSLSARRILHLCVDRTDTRGIARLSRSELAEAMSLTRRQTGRAVDELVEEDFLAQAGYGCLVVNPTKVWAGQRDRAEEARLEARYELHKQHYATTLAKKQAAGRGIWMRRQAVKGAPHGLVEEARGNSRREGAAEAPN
jgi:hypothetical protein